MKRSLVRCAAVLAAMLFACSLLASAQSAGYDLLQTASGASVDLAGVSGLSPSTIPLQGVPICACIGNTDTIMHRTAAVPSGGGAVPVNVYALFMKNSGSVTLNGEAVDVYITINNTGTDIATSVLPQPDTLTESTGTVTVNTGGTFNSDITVNADVIFVPAGANPANSNVVIAHQPAPSINLTSANSTWSTTPSPGYPSAPCYPSGGFYPKPVHTGPHPVVPPAPTPTPTPSPTPSPSPTPDPTPTPTPHPSPSPTPDPTPTPTPHPSPSPTPDPTPTPTPHPSPTPSHSGFSAPSPLRVAEFHEESIFTWRTITNSTSAQAKPSGRSEAAGKGGDVVLTASLSPAAQPPRTCEARNEQPPRPIADINKNRQDAGTVINRDWVPAAVAP